MSMVAGPTRPSAFVGLDAPSHADLSRCVHCGLCLMHCPTFVATGLETESPRGRLCLIRAADEARVEIDDRLVGPIERCRNCRNCESVRTCGVPVGGVRG